jgi:hypothetical protein
LEKTSLKECKSVPDTGGNEMDAFLILPVQRIPRYALLLADLYKHTWEQHADHENLQKSLNQIQVQVHCSIALFSNCLICMLFFF